MLRERGDSGRQAIAHHEGPVSELARQHVAATARAGYASCASCLLRA